MTDRSQWKPLGPAFKAAVRAYDRARNARLTAATLRDTVTVPLYHYTDARGLEGIITAQQIWFTHYEHLNDPSELEFGNERGAATRERRPAAGSRGSDRNLAHSRRPRPRPPMAEIPPNRSDQRPRCHRP
jgi:hypothetical protein